ncbi:MAG: bestrophin family ion channel [Bacteroidota bacterium]
MIDVLGGCERILKTPIPYSYSVYVKKVIFIYLLTLPLSLITSLLYWTVPMVMFNCYVLAGLELMGEEIEDPFGYDQNDLDTDGMAKNIRKNVREILLEGGTMPATPEMAQLGI